MLTVMYHTYHVVCVVKCDLGRPIRDFYTSMAWQCSYIQHNLHGAVQTTC